MFEDNINYEKYIKCISQVLLIDFNFTANDIFYLCNRSIELYETNLKDYMKKYCN